MVDKNKLKTEELERILKEGYEMIQPWGTTGNLKEYGKGNKRLVYDVQYDTIRVEYEIEENGSTRTNN